MKRILVILVCLVVITISYFSTKAVMEYTGEPYRAMLKLNSVIIVVNQHNAMLVFAQKRDVPSELFLFYAEGKLYAIMVKKRDAYLLYKDGAVSVFNEDDAKRFVKEFYTEFLKPTKDTIRRANDQKARKG